jgi:hypothetical protein
MNPEQIQSINEVISALDVIISESVKSNSPLGYFAALYRKVTLQVKDGIISGTFDDGSRMEKLDVAFAKRYLVAYESYRKNEPVTESWKLTFELQSQYWPIVLQHLLMGMNAHINLDLGIAAAEISEGNNLNELENDFNRINDILSSLVLEVEDNLSLVWPALKYLLKWSGKIDDYLVDFSMKLARDGAWKFAGQYFGSSASGKEEAIVNRDMKVASKAAVVVNPGLFASTILRIIRLTERGTVAEKILKLNSTKQI